MADCVTGSHKNIKLPQNMYLLIFMILQCRFLLLKFQQTSFSCRLHFEGPTQISPINLNRAFPVQPTANPIFGRLDTSLMARFPFQRNYLQNDAVGGNYSLFIIIILFYYYYYDFTVQTYVHRLQN